MAVREVNGGIEYADVLEAIAEVAASYITPGTVGTNRSGRECARTSPPRHVDVPHVCRSAWDRFDDQPVQARMAHGMADDSGVYRPRKA